MKLAKQIYRFCEKDFLKTDHCFPAFADGYKMTLLILMLKKSASSDADSYSNL